MLYVTATPLGNLEDMSPRAVRTLSEVDWIACEDTRRTRRLLDHFGVRTATTSLHEHNEEAKTPQLTARLKSGESGALVSDAGTPLISDPGYRLIQACRRAQIGVRAIPGPCAAIAALSISGLPCHDFRFVGFPPKRSRAQLNLFQALAAERSTLIFYLSPHGLPRSLALLEEALGERQAFLVRELTKLHETHYWGSLSEIRHRKATQAPRGEYTLVVEGAASSSLGASIDVGSYVRGLMQNRGLSRSQASKQAASELGLGRREVYGLLGDES